MSPIFWMEKYCWLKLTVTFVAHLAFSCSFERDEIHTVIIGAQKRAINLVFTSFSLFLQIKQEAYD